MTWFIKIAVACAVVVSMKAAMMPSTNLYNWVPGVTVGVYGGIPHRTTIYTNLSPLDGTDYLRISNSLALCPSNQVVFLNPGVFVLTNFPGFIGNSGVTLRGSGQGVTTLLFTNHPGSAAQAIYFLRSQLPTTRFFATDDVPQGGTNITLTAVTGIVTNRLITLYTRDFETNVIFVPNSGLSNHIHFHVAHVRNVTGTTVTFWPPTPWSFKTNLGANAQGLTAMPVSFTGIEDLSIVKATNYVQNFTVQMHNTYSCWFRGVELVRADNTHINTVGTLFTEVRDCYIHDTSSGTDGYGVAPHDRNTGFLIENNAFARLFHSVIAGQMASSVVAYNFSTNTIVPGIQTADFNANHSQGNMYNLWEGNAGAQFNSDSYHGGSFANTVFRNRFHGLHPTLTANRMMIALKRASYWYNVVGNVLGDASWSPESLNVPGGGSTNAYEMTGNPTYTSMPVIYVIGYPHVGNNGYTPGAAEGPYGFVPEDGPFCCDFDTNVAQRLVRHYNYDYFNEDLILDPSITDTNLASSMFRTSKPAYFTSSFPWPPFSPTDPDNSSPTNLPAYGIYAGFSGVVLPESPAGLTISGNLEMSGTIRP